MRMHKLRMHKVEMMGDSCLLCSCFEDPARQSTHRIIKIKNVLASVTHHEYPDPDRFDNIDRAQQKIYAKRKQDPDPLLISGPYEIRTEVSGHGSLAFAIKISRGWSEKASGQIYPFDLKILILKYLHCRQCLGKMTFPLSLYDN